MHTKTGDFRYSKLITDMTRKFQYIQFMDVSNINIRNTDCGIQVMYNKQYITE